MVKIPMTPLGEERLREELQQLKSIERHKIIQAIAEARAHGDLRENAEYHAAKERQGFVEGRIQEIEHKLAHSQVVDLSKVTNEGKVVFGALIILLNLNTEETARYQIVGEDEADLKHGKISVNSPIARAMIGKLEGDSIEVQTPGGVVSYEISEVIYSINVI